MYFFSADWHVFHNNILKYSNRPFDSIDEMNHELIKRHNEVVTDNDKFIHVGDFTLASAQYANEVIRQMNGDKLFLIGSHDYWLKKKGLQMWEGTIEGQHIVANHYPMYSWPRSHFNSWHIFGHHHGRLTLDGKRYDVGVDNNNFYPVSFTKLRDIMSKASDNFNLVKESR